MPHLDLDLDIPPLVTASVLWAARHFALASGISWPSIEAILAATGASPEEAHAIEDTLLDQLAALAVMAKRQTPPPDLVGLDHGAEGPAVPRLDLDIPPLVTASVLWAARHFALGVRHLVARHRGHPRGDGGRKPRGGTRDRGRAPRSRGGVGRDGEAADSTAGLGRVGSQRRSHRARYRDGPIHQAEPRLRAERHARALRGLLPAVRARAAAALLRRDDGRVCRGDRSATGHGGGLAARWAPRRRHDRPSPTSHAWRLHAARLRSSLRIGEPSPAVPPLVTAGVLLAARSLSEPHGVPQPSVGEILRLTGATRSRAYEIKDALAAVLPTLARPPGRPCVEPSPGPATVSELVGIAVEMIQFMKRNPGCVQSGARDRYADGYRRFVLELRERHADVAATEFAAAIDRPLGTLEDWLRSLSIAEPSIAHTTAPCETSATHGVPDPDQEAEHDARQAQIETVLAAWRVWRGSFTAFCAHVRRDHRLELGATLIASILFEYGLRVPARREGRSCDDEALRKSFEIFFPGAQWVGDGKQLTVVIDGKTFHRNLELVVDAASDAVVGISVRDEEDSAAVVQAFTQGVQATGGTPLALLLDNRHSNHTPEVDAALDDTLRIRATTGRPQNKAHVEGSFGLFAQKVPPIVLDTRDPHALATSVANLATTTLFRAPQSRTSSRPRW